MAHADNSAPEIVAVPGFGACAAVWEELRRSLAPRYRLRPLDLPGHGARAAPPEWSLEFCVRECAAGVVGPVVWMGWSLGALVAFKAAALFPQRVRAVVAVAMGPRFLRAPDWPNALSSGAFDEFRRRLESRPGAALGRFFALQARTRSGPAVALTRKLKSLAGACGHPPPEVLVGALDLLENSDLRADCAALRCPVLAILGSDDALVPQAMREDLRRLYSGWRIEVIEGAGHVPFLSHRNLFQHHLEKFLSALAMTGARVSV